MSVDYYFNIYHIYLLDIYYNMTNNKKIVVILNKKQVLYCTIYTITPIKVIELVLQRAIIENIANEQEVDAIENHHTQI